MRGHIEMPPKTRNVLLSRIGWKVEKVENFAVSMLSVLCFGLLHCLIRHVLPRCIFLGQPFQRNKVEKTKKQTHRHNPQSIATGTQNESCLLWRNVSWVCCHLRFKGLANTNSESSKLSQSSPALQTWKVVFSWTNNPAVQSEKNKTMWPLCDHYVELIGILCFVSQCFACGFETQLRSGSYCTHIAQKHHHGDLPNQKQMKHTEKKNPNRNMCWTCVEHVLNTSESFRISKYQQDISMGLVARHSENHERLTKKKKVNYQFCLHMPTHELSF